MDLSLNGNAIPLTSGSKKPLESSRNKSVSNVKYFVKNMLYYYY